MNTTKFNLKDLKMRPKKNLLGDTDLPQKAEGKASGKSSAKSKGGRKPIPKEERLTKKITVNFTKTEFNRLEELSQQNLNIPLPRLVRGLLKQNGII